MRVLAHLREKQDFMKRRTPEEIVALLREAESGTESVLDFCSRKGMVAHKPDPLSPGLVKRTMWPLLTILVLLAACQTVHTHQPTNPATSPSAEIKITSTPRPRLLCSGAPPSDHFAHEDSFGDGYIARVPRQDVANTGQREIAYILVKQWLEHYLTRSESASAAIKYYSINDIIVYDQDCDPFFQIFASVDFSIVPAQIPNDYGSFPSASTTPESATPGDVWGHLVAPFGVFEDGNDYRLRLVFGWGT